MGSWRHSASGAARGLRAGGAPVTDQRRPQGRADEEGENQDEEDVAAAAKVASSLMKHLRPSFSGAPSGDGTDGSRRRMMERWSEAASSKAGGLMRFQMDDGFAGGWAESAAVAQAADERALLSSSSSRRQASQAAGASPFCLATSRSRSSGRCSSRAAERASNGRGGRRGLRT